MPDVLYTSTTVRVAPTGDDPGRTLVYQEADDIGECVRVLYNKALYLTRRAHFENDKIHRWNLDRVRQGRKPFLPVKVPTRHQWNEGIKTSIDIGGNNRVFVGIPYYQLRRRLKELCSVNGILYLEQPESHTSKTSFADGETPQHHETSVGRRTRTKLLRAADGSRLHADVNGPYQVRVKALRAGGLGAVVTGAVRQAAVKAGKNPVKMKVRLGENTRPVHRKTAA